MATTTKGGKWRVRVTFPLGVWCVSSARDLVSVLRASAAVEKALGGKAAVEVVPDSAAYRELDRRREEAGLSELSEVLAVEEAAKAQTKPNSTPPAGEAAHAAPPWWVMGVIRIVAAVLARTWLLWERLWPAGKGMRREGEGESGRGFPFRVFPLSPFRDP